MNETFNKNAKVEKFTNMLGIAALLIVIDHLVFSQYASDNDSYLPATSIVISTSGITS